MGRAMTDPNSCLKHLQPGLAQNRKTINTGPLYQVNDLIVHLRILTEFWLRQCAFIISDNVTELTGISPCPLASSCSLNHCLSPACSNRTSTAILEDPSDLSLCFGRFPSLHLIKLKVSALLLTLSLIMYSGASLLSVQNEMIYHYDFQGLFHL